MWRMIVIGLCLFSLSSMADAQSPTTPVEQVVKLRWGHPTTRENGKAFNAATELERYEINWSVNGEEQPTVTVPFTPVFSTYSITTTLAPRPAPHTIRATVVAVAKDSSRSKPSNEIVQAIEIGVLLSPPVAPSNATMVIECRDCTVRVIP